MSKLDRQLDGVFGEERVEIFWPSDDEVDVDLLRLHLISRIDDHLRRVPLDLRGVNGAPDRLVDLLLELQRYAMSQGKVLSISASLPPMQEALNPRRRRKAGRPQEAIDEFGSRSASEVARTAINSQGSGDPNPLLVSKVDESAERRVGARTKVRRNKKDYLGLVTAIVGILAATLAFHWFWGFETEPLIYDNIKTFENGTGATASPLQQP